MNMVKGIFAGLMLALLVAGCVVRDDDGYGRDYAHGDRDHYDQGRGSDRDYDHDRNGDYDRRDNRYGPH